jgi:putative ABC transport system permease protein
MTITPIASITTPDKPFGDPRTSPMAYLVTSSVEIFRTLGVPVLKGRAFDDRDTAGAPSVAVVSQVVATRLFGAGDPIGREFLLRNHINMFDRKTVRQVTVVGVARDTDTGVVSPDRRDGTVYLPLAQHYEPTLSVVARTSGDPASIVEPLRNAVRMASPDLAMSPMAGPGTIMLTSSYVMLRILAVLTVSLAAIAMLFAMAGLYGVLLQLVAGRTREMGLRAALGALPVELRRLVRRDGLRPVIQGVTAGLVLSVGLRLVLRSRYPGVPILDPIGFVVAPLCFIAAALAACYIPARRASRVDPNVALRDL